LKKELTRQKQKEEKISSGKKEKKSLQLLYQLSLDRRWSSLDEGLHRGECAPLPLLKVKGKYFEFELLMLNPKDYER
jgi:hypothetical protein